VELALGPPAGLPVVKSYPGFNPCFRGTCPRTRKRGQAVRKSHKFQSLFSWNLPSDTRVLNYQAQSYWFQSLFSWNLPSDGYIQTRTCGGCSVSILVFVELALGLSDWSYIPENSEGFNPCFRGTCPRTGFFSFTRVYNTCFNPCFRGTCPRTATTLSIGLSYLCFNPCFRGTCPRTAAFFRPFFVFSSSNRPFPTPL